MRENSSSLANSRYTGVSKKASSMAGQYQTAIIVVTHDEKIIPTFKRLYNIRDGQTIEEVGQDRSVA